MKKSVRLPNYIVPIKYRITIKPDLEAFTFEGDEEIIIDVKKATPAITLHAKELEIESTSISATSPRPSPQKGREREQWAKSTKYDKQVETATFTFPKALKTGKYRLKLGFKGLINDHMRGFYRSSFIHGGKQKHLATSQFEATDARRAFPCFDEPAKKAVFELSFIIPENLSAISNTFITDVKEHSSGYKIVSFAPTPKMSSYLAALIIGDFENLESKTKRGVVVRVHTTPGKKHQAKFALDCAVKILEFYEKYFGIAYPLKTLDLIAIPDFAHGAMENWGAVTFRESALLVDEENSAAANKQWVALVIAHELAHQWFGNLVTMEWWTHLWLNEGFASYIEYLAVNQLFPKWDIWTQFAYNDLGVALKLDSLASTHPIEIEVHHPDEIGEIFDEVSYSKGSSVIRMLAAYLGEKDFRDGLRHYLKKHSYSNASTGDLWAAFEKVSGKQVAEMMRNWTGRPGYPLINIKAEKNLLKISQSRFYGSPISEKLSKQNPVWVVPAGYKIGKSGKIRGLVLQNKSIIVGKPKSGWLKFNPGETGFYRTKYSDELLAGLREPVRRKILPPIDRLGIIRDLFALAQAGKITVTAVLDFARNYKNEDDYNVWVEIASGLDELDSLIFDKLYYPQFKKYASALFAGVSKKLGWQKKPGESHTATLLRSLALSRAGYFGDQKIIARAKKIFRGGKIHPDIRGAVYGLTAQYGGKSEQKKLIALYQKETLHEERNRLGRALGRFQDGNLIKKSLDFFMSRQVRNQDTPMVMAAAFANNQYFAQTWKFVQKNWPELLKRYGHGGHLLGIFIKPLARMRGKDDLAQIRNFFLTHAHPGADRTLRQVTEEIEGNVLRLENYYKDLKKYLS